MYTYYLFTRIKHDLMKTIFKQKIEHFHGRHFGDLFDCEILNQRILSQKIFFYILNNTNELMKNTICGKIGQVLYIV